MARQSLIRGHNGRVGYRAAKDLAVTSAKKNNRRTGQIGFRLNDRLMEALGWRINDTVQVDFDDSDNSVYLFLSPEGNKLSGQTAKKRRLGGSLASVLWFTWSPPSGPPTKIIEIPKFNSRYCKWGYEIKTIWDEGRRVKELRFKWPLNNQATAPIKPGKQKRYPDELVTHP